MERERVRAALEQLTPRDRDVLLLWDAGQSYDEIAAQTGLAKSAIGTDAGAGAAAVSRSL